MNKIIIKNKIWTFKNDRGDFIWGSPSPVSYKLYMPLCNENGMMSSITPYLNGDIKINNDHFLTQPVSIEDLHNTKSARNFWFYITGRGPWSATGNSAAQNSKVHDNQFCRRKVEAGLLWHKVTLTDEEAGLESSILNFAASEHNVEIMMVTVKNISEDEMELTPTSSIPIFARSAENIRDHRHVTSLVNRVILQSKGILVKPVIKFDEKGHKYDDTIYYVLGSDESGAFPSTIIPITKDFIGERGSFDWPETIVKNMKPGNIKFSQLDGKEYTGALQFDKIILNPDEKRTYILLLGISDSIQESNNVFEKFNTKEKVLWELDRVKSIWNEKADNVNFNCGPDDFSNWMRWVCVQPVLRRIFGNSFLPYHDYGKGGRGWRDLWQDDLTLIIQNPGKVRTSLIDNLSGVRIDGTNATIICSKDGEFLSDRNNIPRVWMDHGAWPFLAMRLYIDQTGDFNILFEKTGYFQDAFHSRGRVKNENWTHDEGYELKTIDGEIYSGSVIEHMLLQHMVSFFNVGEHNIILLENADWNDGIDMAMNRGESIAFTALYGSNLLGIAELLLQLKEKHDQQDIEIFEEFQLLFDAKNDEFDYSSVEYKKNLLNRYYYKTGKSISGNKIKISIDQVIDDLLKKAESIFTQIREKEWISIDNDKGFFKSYYDDEGQSIDSCDNGSLKMKLVGQVFTSMSKIATEKQVKSIYNACFNYLKDPHHGGYRLNTEADNEILNFGRYLAFAYGEKENGAAFNHMIVMYMNALYKRKFVREGYEVFSSLYDLCMDVENAKIYQGVPEYFNSEREGFYPYLTGSASWLVLTFLQEVFGIKGVYGDLLIKPQLVKEQFDKNGEASASLFFHGKRIKVIYQNKENLDYGEYRIKGIQFNSEVMSEVEMNGEFISIPQKVFDENTDEEKLNIILIELESIV